MRSRLREIELYTCCGRRSIVVQINADQLSGEAWRLARCLVTTNNRRRDNGAHVASLLTNADLGRLGGWDEAEVARATHVLGAKWATDSQIIDWRFSPFHIWPDHRHGPHLDPEPERLRLMALSYLQREADRITKCPGGGGTVIASGDWSVRLSTEGTGEDFVLLPDEQGEALVEGALDALFGTRRK